MQSKNSTQVNNSRVGSYTRFILSLIFVVNTLLTAAGKPVISDELGNAIVNVVLAIINVITLYKNNYLTKKGKKQKELLRKNGL